MARDGEVRGAKSQSDADRQPDRASGLSARDLEGLGLNKLHRSRVLEDTPAVRGMIERVQHLVRVESHDRRAR